MSLRTGLSWLWREWVRPFGLFLVIVAPLKSAVVDWNWVPTGSMKPTILEGDLVFINKLAYSLRVPFTKLHLERWDLPQRGDIAVLLSPQDDTRLVKRVIGLPGDTVELRDEVLYLNGVRQRYTPADLGPDRDEIHESRQPLLVTEHLEHGAHPVLILADRRAARSFGPLKVPEGHYFVMGDSRDNSYDSRFFGTVAQERIIGRANRVLLSFDLHRYLLPRVLRTGQALD